MKKDKPKDFKMVAIFIFNENFIATIRVLLNEKPIP